MKSLNAKSFEDVIQAATHHLAVEGLEVDVGEWQAMKDVPQTKTIEVEDFSFAWAIPTSIPALQYAVSPNLPWAEDHFRERISGIPWNPPPSHEWWPFAQRSNDEHRNAVGEFSHTYPERIWPKFAASAFTARNGIRYQLGDLGDLIQLLTERPGTRQAYLPIWFPEDGAAALQGERVPCTLGYHFLRREQRLKIVYTIRSCDFLRHFRDDVYMAARLCQHVAAEIGATPGDLVMHISSLHIFEPEKEKIRQDYTRMTGKSIGRF